MGRDYFNGRPGGAWQGMGHKVLLPPPISCLPRTKILPPNGGYVTSSYFGDKIYHRITNIGRKPTVGERLYRGWKPIFFDCKERSLRRGMPVDFKKSFEAGTKFPSLEALKSRLLADAEDGKIF